MLAMPWPRSSRPSSSIGMPLPLSCTTSCKSPSAMRQRIEQCVRAAVLDDVAHRLAQDARGLHEGARRQRLRQFLGGRAPVGLDAGLRPGATRPRRASRPARRSAAPACRSGRAPTGASLPAPRAPAWRCARDSLVCTMVSSLAPRSSCRSAAMRLRSCSVTCSTRSSASWVKLCSISARGLADARSPDAPCSPRPPAARVPCCCSRRRPTSTIASGVAICASCVGTRAACRTVCASVLHRQRQRGHAQQQRHRPERAARARGTACAGRTPPRPASAAPAARTRSWPSDAAAAARPAAGSPASARTAAAARCRSSGGGTAHSAAGTARWPASAAAASRTAATRPWRCRSGRSRSHRRASTMAQPTDSAPK